MGCAGLSPSGLVACSFRAQERRLWEAAQRPNEAIHAKAAVHSAEQPRQLGKHHEVAGPHTAAWTCSRGGTRLVITGRTGGRGGEGRGGREGKGRRGREGGKGGQVGRQASTQPGSSQANRQGSTHTLELVAASVQSTQHNHAQASASSEAWEEEATGDLRDSMPAVDGETSIGYGSLRACSVVPYHQD